jgi:hypothetical protein
MFEFSGKFQFYQHFNPKTRSSEINKNSSKTGRAESNFRLATKRSNPEIFPFSTRKGKSTFCYRISPTLGWYFDATMEEGGPWNFDFGPGIEIEFKRM